MKAPEILIVDDEPANRRLLRKVLGPMGYELREAVDGEEALAEIRAAVPDIVLLDLNMPKLDGYSVCRQIKSDPRTRLVPVVMLTGMGELPNKLKAVELGVDDFLAKPFNVTELTTRVRSLLSLKRYTDELENASNVLHSIALVVERRDAYTGEHCKRVGECSVQMGIRFGLDDEELKTLRLGAIFHDLGKIAVPDAILRKGARLSSEEWKVLRQHPIVGAELVQPMRTMDKVVTLIRHHHERMDGSGYPDGLSGGEVPLAVRILSVADIHDALATDRPYRKALAPEECRRILKEEQKRGWWDGEVLEILFQVMR